MKEVLQKLLLLIFCSILTTSCAHPWMGKTLPAAQYPQFSPGLEGHHTIPFEGGQVTLDYDWFINEERNHIRLDGTFEINSPEWKYMINSTFKDANIVFKMFLLDENYKIIEVDQIYIPIDNNSTTADYIFKKNLPYKYEYKYVTYRFQATAKIY